MIRKLKSEYRLYWRKINRRPENAATSGPSRRGPKAGKHKRALQVFQAPWIAPDVFGAQHNNAMFDTLNAHVSTKRDLFRAHAMTKPLLRNYALRTEFRTKGASHGAVPPLSFRSWPRSF